MDILQVVSAGAAVAAVAISIVALAQTWRSNERNRADALMGAERQRRQAALSISLVATHERALPGQPCSLASIPFS